MENVVRSMLGAFSLLALLGIRYPLQMLPLLFFEFLWKSLWGLVWGLPLWLDNELDPSTRQTLVACLMGIVPVPLVIPWRYVLNQYVKAPGDPWRTSSMPAPPSPSPSHAPTSSGL